MLCDARRQHKLQVSPYLPYTHPIHAVFERSLYLDIKKVLWNKIDM